MLTSFCKFYKQWLNTVTSFVIQSAGESTMKQYFIFWYIFYLSTLIRGLCLIYSTILLPEMYIIYIIYNIIHFCVLQYIHVYLWLLRSWHNNYTYINKHDATYVAIWKHIESYSIPCWKADENWSKTYHGGARCNTKRNVSLNFRGKDLKVVHVCIRISCPCHHVTAIIVLQQGSHKILKSLW